MKEFIDGIAIACFVAGSALLLPVQAADNATPKPRRAHLPALRKRRGQRCDKQTGKWVAYPVDEQAMSEEERVRHVGRPLSKIGEVLDRMNRDG